MARKYDVTRNFEIYNAKCVLFNLDNDEMKKVEITLNTKDVSKKALEKYVKNTYGDKYTVVKFKVVSIGSIMYGMTASDFIRHGVRLNPDNRQPYPVTDDEQTMVQDNDEDDDATSTENEYTENDNESENE